ncbi:hypothetical protein OPV22_018368 [Ensete ventricosum]|uniref:Ubiquitin-like protease family profile domain-containing protein n=1 Tax=Ensete ventricosum TaxID=4639 RepID=A0AAV8R4D6_ENSVE|nr:hypothetical protein OPV22_018368 [Ensete ventricosum]
MFILVPLKIQRHWVDVYNTDQHYKVKILETKTTHNGDLKRRLWKFDVLMFKKVVATIGLRTNVCRKTKSLQVLL